MAPELRAEAHALMAEINDIARLRREIAAHRHELAQAAAALAADRAQVAQLVTQRLALTRPLLPDAANDATLQRMAARAKDIGELIRLADAATERRDRDLAARQTADSTRPAAPRAFDPPQSALRLPISGTISRRFGEPSDANGAPAAGLNLKGAVPGSEVVAPFDGQIVYAGAFRDLGLLLIIRHGALYHSVLGGLAGIGVVAGEWVTAGEPVGAMPGSPASQGAPTDEGTGNLLYFEVRRGSQPVDPQPWLATQAAGRGAANGEQKVDQ
ncbi:MAG TPA: peptidoglycan DD-metalloendopeptidase family protein [Stellaceae bacterium]|nr:peptidoglycan DD-metalloendopeptidase family protein [Stellaceae bacterium]